MAIVTSVTGRVGTPSPTATLPYCPAGSLSAPSAGSLLEEGAQPQAEGTAVCQAFDGCIIQATQANLYTTAYDLTPQRTITDTLRAFSQTNDRYQVGYAINPLTIGWVMKTDPGVNIPSQSGAACTALPFVNPPTPTPTLTPTPMAPTLADYGITVRYDDVPDGTDFGSGLVWSAAVRQNEQAALLRGVERVAQAFDKEQVIGATLADQFKRVMGPIVFLRLAPTPPANTPFQVYYDGLSYDTVCFVSSEGNLGMVIACRGYMLQEIHWQTGGLVTEEAFVHELGHVFDAISVINELYLHSYVDKPSEYTQEIDYEDCYDRTIWGDFKGIWVRGERGWGSSKIKNANPSISQFQQNPYSQPDRSLYVIEATADMFLNWVYRKTTDQTFDVDLENACAVTSSQGSWDSVLSFWSGFRNIDKNENFDGILPSGPNYLSGNRRYQWMDKVIDIIFTNKGWLNE